MTITIPVPRLRSLALVLSGVVLGALLVGPVSAGVVRRGVTPSAVQTRFTSCAGLHFYPNLSSVTYYSTGTQRYSDAALLICDPHLPHRAVVTAVRFSLLDVSTTHEVKNCALGRHPLTVAGMGDVQVMASVPATGVSNRPGLVRRSDTTIAFATVNANQYAYWLQCEVTGTQPSIFGASVRYTIDPAYG